MTVVDASVIVELLLRTPAAPRMEAALFDTDAELAAPELLDVEVAQVIRRYALARDLDETRGREALDDLADLPLTRYPHTPLLPRVWELRDHLTAYDAVYVALAEALGGPLFTRDEGIARAPGIRAPVELV